jgi:hypothetical protein
VASTVACGGGAPPELANIDDQVAQVGVEFRLELVATDPDGDEIDFEFRSDVPDIDGRASISRSPNGTGIFKWTPLASDVQEWVFDFVASDGSNDTTLPVTIDVRGAVGSETAPVFRKPLGTGTTLDTAKAECINLDIVIEDQDNAEVLISHEEPKIEGAELEQTNGLEALWRWCPTRTQADAEDRYTLTLAADDSSNPMTLKNYLVVLRGGNGAGCPGQAPVIAHTAADESTIVDLTIAADISDDKGLKQPPLFYYSETPPANPPQLGQMTQTTMILISGDMQNGTWAADVPNPVVGQGSGASAELYYVIVADDDDDEMGNCDHLTQMPSTGTYQMTVTNPGGSGTTATCGSCSADVQCGSSGGSEAELCVNLAATQTTHCLQGCSGPGTCPSGYTCSSSPVTSISGASGRACIPDTGTCAMTQTCIDDSYEDNDTRIQAAANPALYPDLYEFTSCPAGTYDDDEDWFEISITSSSRVNVELAGEETSDLDLGLYDSTGTRITSSTSLSSSEMVSSCVPPGDYYIRVYAWDAAPNDYYLDWSRTAETCAMACTDDTSENDDTISQARIAAYPYYSDSSNQICADDVDVYEVDLLATDNLVIDLTFTQSNPQQDLDLTIWDSAGTDLWPCCQTSHGQSADSNEHAEFTPTAAGTYYVVVSGYNHSANSYAITIDYQ